MSSREFEETNSSTSGDDTDVNAQVQAVLREAYLQASEDLRDFAARVGYYNEQKKAIRSYLKEARRFRAGVLVRARESGIDLCRGDETNVRSLEKLIEGQAHTHDGGDIGYELCLPMRVPPEGVSSIESLDAVISEWEDKLNSLGDDAQLAQIDLQNMLQKQQQALQMMSRISKEMHDTAMSIIRNMGG